MNKTESNAALYCSWIRNGYRKCFIIEWKKSIYGLTPHIYCDATDSHRDCVRVSGCGYDKTSTALAHFLCYLFIADERVKLPYSNSCKAAFDDVRRCAGSGVDVVTDALARHGWILEEVASSANATAYTIKRA